jgi:hypothetical protein
MSLQNTFTTKTLKKKRKKKKKKKKKKKEYFLKMDTKTHIMVCLMWCLMSVLIPRPSSGLG